MKATQQLMDEHGAVKVVLLVLEKISQKIEAGEKVNFDHLKDIIDFLQGFVDKCHHGKEEDILFPAMVKVGIPNDHGPIKVMLDEHVLGRQYVKALSQGIFGYTDGDTESINQIISYGRKYSKLLMEHVKKEDEVLYVMADKHILEDDQEIMFEEFEKLEIERIGLGKHEEYHKMLHKLKAEYL